MPPVMMIRVIPSAMRPTSTKKREVLSRVVGDKNSGSSRVITITSAISTPSSAPPDPPPPAQVSCPADHDGRHDLQLQARARVGLHGTRAPHVDDRGDADEDANQHEGKETDAVYGKPGEAGRPAVAADGEDVAAPGRVSAN